MRVAAIAVSVFAFVAGCSDARSHPFLGRQYLDSRHCLLGPATLDVVDGTDKGSSCALKCLASPPDRDGGRGIYVSTACPPYPPLYDTSGAVPGCAEALGAAQRNDTCLEDGGSTHPPVDLDSGVLDQ